ncbi:MAG: hypothetical protein KDC88_12880 [Ignavibacteriae bacterium]|nr:hypothetical protein [Ignavibacteriota bacterium]MCB9217939.1 hypothetical protein [Ignavibacteriales bacterium]MCB9260328.1 hypothetical protein [Ignavibacteriales bacterium]
MKKLLVLFSLLSFILVFSGCSDDDNNPTNSNTDEMNLDSDLYGSWVFVDSNNDVHGWTFNNNGTCVQTLYNQNVSWKWTIENEQIKLYLDGGNPAYYTYKIEGNQLYLWVDVISDWGLPYTKQ